MHLSVSGISKSYGSEQILNGISFAISFGQRVGLIGANGVGKTTLLKIIIGEVEPDSGEINIPKDMDIGYLPQVIPAFPGKTIEDIICEAQNNLHQIEERIRYLESIMANSDADKLDKILIEYEGLTEQFEQKGGYDIDYRIGAVLEGLQIGHISREREVNTLSGGEKSRVGLAALLLLSPWLLILDEPTNHLDFSMLEWLEQYLQSHRGALLIVSHDRYFLNRTITTILEIDEHSRMIKQYSGNYEVYLREKERALVKWHEEYKRQGEEIKELKQIIKGKARQIGHNRPAPDKDKITHKFFGERVQKAVSRNVKAAEEKLRRIRENPILKPPQPIRINPQFSPRMLKNKNPITVSQVYKSFDKQFVLKDINCILNANSCIIIIGKNGAGKSTLLKIIAGFETPDSGQVTLSPNVQIGYLDQEQESLKSKFSQTVFDVYSDGLIGHKDELIASILKHGLFSYEEIYKKVGTLSIGQRRKLQIARLIAEQANLLLLDEPTNHVSFDVLENFEKALLEFPGSIIAVSHDRRFIERFAKQIWEIRNGQLIKYLGGFENYLSSTRTTID